MEDDKQTMTGGKGYNLIGRITGATKKPVAKKPVAKKPVARKPVAKKKAAVKK